MYDENSDLSSVYNIKYFASLFWKTLEWRFCFVKKNCFDCASLIEIRALLLLISILLASVNKVCSVGISNWYNSSASILISTWDRSELVT